MSKYDYDLGCGKADNQRTSADVGPTSFLPSDASARKAIPVATGCLDYFPTALAAVAEVSRVGNDQHNPGKPLHWDRAKSTDEADCLIRHFLERGTIDTDGVRHSAKVAWRALALLEKEIEAELLVPIEGKPGGQLETVRREFARDRARPISTMTEDELLEALTPEERDRNTA
jgi:hypothetical protein